MFLFLEHFFGRVLNQSQLHHLKYILTYFSSPKIALLLSYYSPLLSLKSC